MTRFPAIRRRAGLAAMAVMGSLELPEPRARTMVAPVAMAAREARAEMRVAPCTTRGHLTLRMTRSPATRRPRATVVTAGPAGWEARASTRQSTTVEMGGPAERVETPAR